MLARVPPIKRQAQTASQGLPDGHLDALTVQLSAVTRELAELRTQLQDRPPTAGPDTTE